MTDTERLLTVSEAAEILRVSPRTLTLWLREGRVVGVKLPGPKGQWRVKRRDVDGLIEAWSAPEDEWI